MSFRNAKIVGSGVSQAEYRKVVGGKVGSKEFVMSRSQLVKFAACPAKWRAGIPEKEDTKALRFGTLLDLMVFSTGEYAEKVIMPPTHYQDSKGKEAKWTNKSSTCRDWEESKESEGFFVSSEDEEVDIVAAASRLKLDARIKEILGCSKPSVLVTAEWECPYTKLVVPVAILQDFMPDKRDSRWGRYLGDLKTCRDASHKKWKRAVFDHRYDVQAAFYSDVVNAIDGEARDSWVHILVENTAPFEPGRRFLSAEFVELGRSFYTDALNRYCQCLSTDNWTGFDDAGEIDGFTIVQPESWMVEGPTYVPTSAPEYRPDDADQNDMDLTP